MSRSPAPRPRRGTPKRAASPSSPAAAAARPKSPSAMDTWEAFKLLTVQDPTFLFAVSCLVSVLFVEGDESTQTLRMKTFSPVEALGHLFDPAVLIGVMVAVTALKLVFDKGIKSDHVHRGDFLRAGWFLWNACLFHVTLDGLGSFGLLPLMRENYELLDARLKSEHANAMRVAKGLHVAAPGETALVEFVVRTELFVMSVVCLGAFYGILTGARFRDECEMLASLMHVCGTLVWSMPELMTGCVNCVPIGKPGCVPGTSLYELFFYWFAFGINILWVIVPLLCLAGAFERSVAIKAAAAAAVVVTT